jgi:hypothetical protein
MNPDDPATLDHGEVFHGVDGGPIDRHVTTYSSIDT